ncbi:MAG: TetR/AcrR family transcriptional regulator [Sphingobium sp.]|uniref:TetR/AcrR family transcriptional regulator n=1 Tax=Sphingobium sp. TaxID=1912891 RepID=UPI003BAE805C
MPDQIAQHDEDARAPKHRSSSGGGESGPKQKRSRERAERILTCAVEIMAEKGVDAFRMSDLAERTGIAFGSLYQYFPNRTAVLETLARRYNLIGHACVDKELQNLRSAEDIHAVLCAITDSYTRFFLDEPAVQLIWQATQASRQLQAMDAEDGAHLTDMLYSALRAIAPEEPPQALADFAQVVMVLMAAAVRHAITLPANDRDRFLNLFKRTLPTGPAGLGS